MPNGTIKDYMDENDQFVITDEKGNEWTANYADFQNDNPHMTLIIRGGMKVSFELDSTKARVEKVRAIS
jgi:hypothetical protein